MSAQDISVHQLQNGLTLVVETMRDVQSAAFSILVPGGSVHDLPGQNGSASALSDWMIRGAGDYDSKLLQTTFDNLGVQHHEGAGLSHLSFSGATLADKIPAALRVYADVIRRPHLPDDQFGAVKAGLEQALNSIEDEPRQKVMIELRRRTYPLPWGLPTEGSLDDLANISPEVLRSHYARCLQPDKCIIGIAGHVDCSEMIAVVEECFGDWPSQTPLTVETTPSGPRLDHIEFESTQTHIGIAFDAVPYRDERYYDAWAAVGVLSGGMSSRLFTEVREKRGLCYSVSASLNSLPTEGRILCYAGTTTERAQETLDVTLQEIQRLPEGILPAELDRCKARAKSSLIMQQESTSARASALAKDWHHLGRVTTLDEVRTKIEHLTVESILSYLAAHPPRDFTVLTIGSEPLEVQSEVS